MRDKHSSSSLRTLQRQFQRHVLNGGDEIVKHIVGTSNTGIDRRLGIYVKGYRTRLTEGLAADFPALHTFVGEKRFAALADAYIDAHPSEHFSMRYFGSGLSEFLAGTSDIDSPLLSEMAAFEWRLHDAFDAADADVCSVDDIGKIEPSSWGHMRFGFHPSVNRLDLVWNAAEIWNAVKKNQELPKPKASHIPVPWLIWRQDLSTYFRSLSVDEAGLIDTSIAGQSLAQVCEQLCAWTDAENVAARAASLVKQWVSDGLIVSVSIRE